MALVRLVPEDQTTGKVAALYEEIKSELGIDFVPNLYKAMHPIRITSKPTGEGSRPSWSRRGGSIA